MAFDNSPSDPAGGNTGGSSSQPGGVQGGGQSSGGGGSLGVNNPNLAGSSGAPSIVELSEDSMVKLPGAKDPVRYGDHYRTFQSEFTKRAQEASRLKQEAQQLRQQLQEHQRRLQQGQQQQGQGQQPPSATAKLGELANSLKSLTYLSGQDAARVVEHLTQQFAGQEAALQRRDLAIGLMFKELKKMGGTLNQLHSSHTSTEFESKITKFAKDGGIPDRLLPRVKELYLAYEGEDLDQEFPQILKGWYDDVQGAFRDNERKRVEDARRQPFVPGKGGNGTPSKPLANFARSSAREIADAVWPGMVDGDVET